MDTKEDTPETLTNEIDSFTNHHRDGNCDWCWWKLWGLYRSIVKVKHSTETEPVYPADLKALLLFFFIFLPNIFSDVQRMLNVKQAQTDNTVDFVFPFFHNACFQNINCCLFLFQDFELIHSKRFSYIGNLFPTKLCKQIYVVVSAIKQNIESLLVHPSTTWNIKWISNQ